MRPPPLTCPLHLVTSYVMSIYQINFLFWLCACLNVSTGLINRTNKRCVFISGRRIPHVLTTYRLYHHHMSSLDSGRIVSEEPSSVSKILYDDIYLIEQGVNNFMGYIVLAVTSFVSVWCVTLFYQYSFCMYPEMLLLRY